MNSKLSIHKKYLGINKFIYLCLSIFCLSACENDLKEIRKYSYYEEIPTEVADNVEMMYSDSFQVVVIIRTPQLIRYAGAKPREEFVGGLEVDFIGKNLQVASKLTAKEAIKKTVTIKDEKNRNIREPIVIVKDSVVLAGSNGELLFTDELIWYENLGKLSTDKWVRIITGDKDIFGFGFESDKEFKNWKIRSVIGEFKSDGLIDGMND